MITGVIGSRTFNDFQTLQNTLQGLKITKIVSGGARGADTLAKIYAQKFCLPFVELKPDYKKNGSKAPFVRNAQILQQINFLVAFWNGKSGGTAHTIDRARKMGIKIHIVYF